MGLKLFCWITGDDYEVVKRQDVLSRKKISMYGLGIFLPTSIWLIVGYLLTRTFFELPVYGSVIAALFIAALIFVIETLIIRHVGGWKTMALRLLLGLTVSLIGSVIIDEYFFSRDLDNRMITYREGEEKAFVQDKVNALDSTIASLSNEVNLLRSNWQNSLAEVAAEADGSNGSGQTGVGEITQLKLNIAEQKKSQLVEGEMKLAAMEMEREGLEGEAKISFNERFDDHALITRIKVMMLLFKDSHEFKVVWICFTLFVMILEFFIIFLKMGKHKTLYEQKLAFEHELGEQKLKDLIKRREALKLYQGENSYLLN